jgi:hypothetical protein
MTVDFRLKAGLKAGVFPYDATHKDVSSTPLLLIAGGGAYDRRPSLSLSSEASGTTDHWDHGALA